jgi:hypothetical protein
MAEQNTISMSPKEATALLWDSVYGLARKPVDERDIDKVVAVLSRFSEPCFTEPDRAGVVNALISPSTNEHSPSLMNKHALYLDSIGNQAWSESGRASFPWTFTSQILFFLNYCAVRSNPPESAASLEKGLRLSQKLYKHYEGTRVGGDVLDLLLIEQVKFSHKTLVALQKVQSRSDMAMKGNLLMSLITHAPESDVQKEALEGLYGFVDLRRIRTENNFLLHRNCLRTLQEFVRPESTSAKKIEALLAAGGVVRYEGGFESRKRCMRAYWSLVGGLAKANIDLQIDPKRLVPAPSAS